MGIDLSIDIITDREEVLLSERKLDIIMELLISRIGMSYAGSTQSLRFEKDLDGNGPGGISITKMLKESHIAIHTTPEYNHIHIVISSCRNFDSNKAIDVLREVFRNPDIIESSINFWRNIV